MIGKAGRFTTEKSGAFRRKRLAALFYSALGLGAGWGATTMALLAVQSVWLKAGCVVVLLVGFWAIQKFLFPQLDAWRSLAEKYELGTVGEMRVAKILTELPDDYYVINGLSTDGGDLDHVVIGPTGVFVVDAKHWRGVVSADGTGELLLNDNITSKPEISRFVGRMMGTRDRVRRHERGIEPFYQAVFAFTRARLDVKPGCTGNVKCLRDDELLDYVQDEKHGKQLSPSEAGRIADVFRGIAHMDKGFAQPVAVPAAEDLPTA